MLSGWFRDQRENLLVMLATGLLAAGYCFVAPTLFKGEDYVHYWGPATRFLADAVRAARIPLWNPYTGLGRPHLADMQNAVFYPPVYLTCLGEGIGCFLLVWLHCLLGALGMRRLASALAVGRWQSYFMAFSYLASGALTGRWSSGQIPYGCALCYVPLLLYCALRTEGRWAGRRIALHALMLALQLLCGHPQVFWFTAIGQTLLIVGRAVRVPLRQAALDAGRCLCQLAVAGLWSLGLVAVAVLPFLELAGEGNRAATSRTFVNFGRLEWHYLGSLVSPLGLWEGWRYINWEMNLFVGPIILVLGLAGLCRVRERNVRGFWAVLGGALVMAVGDQTPCFGLFYHWLPAYASFRIHAREGLLVVVVLICSAGIWLSRPHPWLAAMWAGSFDLPATWVITGLVLAQGLILWHATSTIKVAYTYSAVWHRRPDFPFQHVLAAQLQRAGLLSPDRPPPRVCVPSTLVPANYAMVYRYSNFDADCSLFLQRPWAYLHAALGLRPSDVRNHTLASEIYGHGPFPYPDLGLAAGIEPATGSLQLATNPAPRAFLVYAAEVEADSARILAQLTNGYDIHQSALLEQPLMNSLPHQWVRRGTAAVIRRFEPNLLLVEVDAKEACLLVLAEAWYPGWRAEIDGRVYACVPANLWMRAVPVPAGRHQVRMYFHQDYLLPGLLISVASASLLLLVLAPPKRQPP